MSTSKTYTKIIHPCTVDAGMKRRKDAYCKITIKDTDKGPTLSICGVVGPTPSGNAYSSGQCVDVIREGTPTKMWDKSMLSKLCDIWERWHLNDMREHCEHQVGEEWNANRQVTLYKYKMGAVLAKQSETLKERVKRDIGAGCNVRLNDDERRLYNAPYFVKSDSTDAPAGYERYSEETKPVSSLHPMDSDTKLGDKHPLGILTKPCPVCGYKWGSSWRYEPLPEDVVEWLKNLPGTDKTPAWC